MEIGAALTATLGGPIGDLWTMRNGYALCSAEGLEAIAAWLGQADAQEIDSLRAKLSIGLHREVETTVPGASAMRVSQAFCSALPVAYSPAPSANWRPFATLVLEAAYEATLLAGAHQAAEGGSNIVLLTLLGGGVFGNAQDWIFAALRRAVEKVEGVALDIRLVSYTEPTPDLRRFVESLARQA